MHHGKYVLSQIMDLVVRYQFNQCVLRYRGERWVKRFSCFDQFLAMAFGQLSFRESLRDVVVCLSAHRAKLYHLGFRSQVARNTLAHANEHRDWCIWRDYTMVLIGEALHLYRDDYPSSLDLSHAVYVIDSTIIELCLSLFPWARLKTVRAAIKINLELSLNGNIPSFFDLSSGKEHDVRFLDLLAFEKDAYYCFDRGYADFERLHVIHRAGAYFVIRAKDNLSFRRLYSRRVDKRTGVRCDQIIVLEGYYTKQAYPDKLRRIKYYDAETNRTYVFLTNDFELSAQTIADIYKHRWQVELFFKWIKQHLAIKAFWGRSANAVKTQICIAMCTYLLVAIMKKRLGVTRNSYEILQILSTSLVDKSPLFTLISEARLQNSEPPLQKQLKLWDY